MVYEGINNISCCFLETVTSIFNVISELYKNLFDWKGICENKREVPSSSIGMHNAWDRFEDEYRR
ncbi:hypothetical protein D3C73_1483320 [compost metagenome]